MRSYTELMRYIAYFLVFIGIRKNPKKELILKIFISMVLVNSFILSCLAIIYEIRGVYLPETQIRGMNLFYPIYGHNSLVDLLIFSIPITISLISVIKWRLIRLLPVILSIFFIFSLVLTFGRAAMLSLTITFMALLLLKKINIEAKSWYIATILLGTTTILFFLSSFIYSNFMIHSKAKTIRGFYKPIEGEFRLTYIKQAFIGLSLSPIFGTGLDTFRQISFENKGKDSYSMSSYTHNHYLEILSEAGLAGGGLFILLIFLILFIIYKNLFKNIEMTSRNGIYIGLIASSLQSFLDYNWQFYSVFLIYWIGIALLLNRKQGSYYFTTELKVHYILILFIIILFSFQLYLSTTPFYKLIIIKT
jgi:O-antigen ligase